MLLGRTETTFIVEQLNQAPYKLTEWERGFLASVTVVVAGGTLTDKQQDTLSRIWDKV